MKRSRGVTVYYWIKMRLYLLRARYVYRETCPHFYGKGVCEGSRSCGFYGEPVCVTSPLDTPWWRR